MTTAAFKKQVIANSENAVAGDPPVSCSPNCQPCRRVDLQLLVITPSVVASEHARMLTSAGYAWAPAFDAEFDTVKRKATLPVARIACPGYLMAYYPQRDRWDVWQVMNYGLTRKVMHQVNTAQYAELQIGFAGAPEAKTCSRKAANLTAQLISIEGAASIDKVWIAYTRNLWTAATLQRYGDNPEVDVSGPDGTKKKLRDLRGRELSPKRILGGAVPAGALPLNTATLEHHVADFAAVASAGFKKAFTHALKPLDGERFGQAKECHKQVRAIEMSSGPTDNPTLYLNKSIVLMVPDPVGVADQHNILRTEVLSDMQAWLAGGADATGKNADPERPWKRQSMLHAAFIRNWVRVHERDWQTTLVNQGVLRTTLVIPGSEYREIQMREKKSGRRHYPEGTSYERLPGEPERYYVILPKNSIEKGIAGTVLAETSRKIERYNKHLNLTAIDSTRKIWLDQEQGWQKLLIARDTDHVEWLKTPVLSTALSYDYDDRTALSESERTRKQIVVDVHDAVAKLEAIARCYGGGALSDVSLIYLINEFKKDITDKSHFIAAAFIQKFDFSKKIMTDPGTQADLYDAVDAMKGSGEQFREAWHQVRQPGASAAAILVQTAQQVTLRMQEVAGLPGVAARLDLKIALKDASQKQVIWARAAGLHAYLETGEHRYVVGIKCADQPLQQQWQRARTPWQGQP